MMQNREERTQANPTKTLDGTGPPSRAISIGFIPASRRSRVSVSGVVSKRRIRRSSRLITFTYIDAIHDRAIELLKIVVLAAHTLRFKNN